MENDISTSHHPPPFLHRQRQSDDDGVGGGGGKGRHWRLLSPSLNYIKSVSTAHQHRGKRLSSSPSSFSDKWKFAVLEARGGGGKEEEEEEEPIWFSWMMEGGPTSKKPPAEKATLPAKKPQAFGFPDDSGTLAISFSRNVPSRELIRQRELYVVVG